MNARLFLFKLPVWIFSYLTVLQVNHIQANEVITFEDPISCKVTGEACQLNKMCEFRCNYACLKVNDPTIQVYGSRIYSANSSICRSAFHDLRIPKQIHLQRSVTITRYETDNCHLESSIRFGISSIEFSNKTCDVFEFVGPYISELILDVASIHENFLFEDGDVSVQRCLISTTNLKGTMRFEDYSKWSFSTNDDEKLTTLDEIVFEKRKSRNPSLSTVDGLGGLQCVPEDALQSTVTSISFHKHAAFYPKRLTVTANKQENVTLVMKEMISNGRKLDVVWRKNKKVIKKAAAVGSEEELTLYDVNVESSGIYSLGYNTSKPEELGYMHLIVRSCPEGLYGFNCANACPVCLNGGLCHDITGECICSPGFNGSTCGNACQPGYVGKACSMKCSTSDPSHSDTGSCKGLLICLPQPYGCSCAKGFAGLFCESRYPVRSQPAKLLKVTEDTISITFKKWIYDTDEDYSDPAMYEVILKEIYSNFSFVQNLTEPSENDTYLVEFEDLKPNALYFIGVIPVDKSGFKEEKDISWINATTLCGKPSNPPSGVGITVIDQNISINWTLPLKDTWNCWEISTIIKLKDISRNFMKELISNDTFYAFHSDPWVAWQVVLCAASVNSGAAINCAESTDFTSHGPLYESSPEVQIKKRATSVTLTWVPPIVSSDRLSKYVIQSYEGTESDVFSRTVLDLMEAICAEHQELRHCVTIKDLNPGKTYKFEIILYPKNSLNGTLIKQISVKMDKNFRTAEVLLTVVPMIFILVVLCSVFFVKKFKKSKSQLKVKFLPYKVDNQFAASNEGLDELDIIETESLSEEISNRIPVKDFPEYVKQNSQNDNIRKEFVSIPIGQIYPCSVAKLSENKPKNRYGNILPYDHNRVVLSIVDDDPFSDYIHANYIHGYNKVKRYIATQGPLQNTINDFWRMVWKENSCKIMMITSFAETGKPKCEKYWTDETGIYGEILVTLENTTSYADFTIRTFIISRRKESKEIKHFHFTSWPDHGSPINATPFVNYMRKVRCYREDFEAPIIVHCSAGIGRSGTAILLDIMIDMGTQEQHVDVANYLFSMRKQRMNIVENIDQYMFVHYALIEFLCIKDTTIELSAIQTESSQIDSNNEEGKYLIENEFQILNTYSNKICYKDFQAAYSTENRNRNRTMSILPPDRARPYLTTSSTNSDYINAVYIDSFTRKDAYVTTQYPLPNTVTDFWSMVYELKSKSVILLQKVGTSSEEIPQLWIPQNTQTFGAYEIKHDSTTTEGNLITSKLQISHEDQDNNEPFTVHVFELTCWPLGSILPTDSHSLLQIVSKLNSTQAEEGNHIITIVCSDGVTASGILCGLLHLCNRIKEEKNVDIFQAVKCIRSNRPQFITDVAQYKFLYELISTYMKSYWIADINLKKTDL